jgi:ABC-type polysaccharide/polyol phosphate transport system ATPase subunit
MQMRLGFSVAVHAQPDILIVDEVLAVGDESFQRKCFDWLRRFQRRGGTILFVSHDPTLVSKLSDRVLHLRGGQLKGDERVARQVFPLDTITAERG